MTSDPGRLGLRERWPLRTWRWFWVGVGLIFVAACSAVWVPRQSDPATPALSSAAPSSAVVEHEVPKDKDAPGAAPFLRLAGDGPEGRLIAAYLALGQGQGREALRLTSELVQDHPDFSLAQLLYGDLLAARAGFPAAFGADVSRPAGTQDPARLALREEAQRRLLALRERPPVGRVPAEFVRLAPTVRHAVAVDASRSRLYLFANGPEGLRLVRDFYVSVGKDGIDKFVEGDRRTPLGVYWITASVPKKRLDERFGHGALKFNYPNALDRQQGRTGSGLYLHGVPPESMNRAPYATDGCVAMANGDVEELLRLLEVDVTPVVITGKLRWVTPNDTRQAAAEFEPAWRAWSSARREADTADTARWYLPDAGGTRRWTPAPEQDAQLSMLAWHDGDTPMMVVTLHGAGAQAQYRQYWKQQRGKRWRIAFEDAVNSDGSLLAQAR